MRVHVRLMNHDTGEVSAQTMTFRDGPDPNAAIMPYIIGRNGVAYHLDETADDESGRWAYYVAGAGTSREPAIIGLTPGAPRPMTEDIAAEYAITLDEAVAKIREILGAGWMP